uniref:Protein BCCIP homolog n=1 Tax=Timema poppense TaxID=170557 RepID=A0A7R9CQ26_TIMPO|nr:unnamed protein product [Timema poppensis]
MAAPLKKRVTGNKDNTLERNSDSDNSDDSATSDIGKYVGQEEIQVDFEGRNPIDSDFHGIKQLLQQLFLKAHINLAELTDLIIGQSYVGSVVKQSELDEDDSDDGTDANDVFGITTVVNLTDKQNLECVQQLRSLLIELCNEHATDQTNTLVRSLLGDDTRPVGLLINERFVNIPSQIAVPLLDSLSKEISRAKQKKMPFDFSYFILICKLYKVADCRFEFCVKGESDSGLSGTWQEDDVEMTPYRRVLLFQADKIDSVIDRIKTFVAQ